MLYSLRKQNGKERRSKIKEYCFQKNLTGRIYSSIYHYHTEFLSRYGTLIIAEAAIPFSARLEDLE